MNTLYGIRSCDSVRKARRWLETRDIPFRFHDFRADGVESSWLRDRIEELGWEALLNRRSATWRQLPAEHKGDLDRTAATLLLQEHPTLIRRPLLDTGEGYLLGFDPDVWASRLDP